jgi:hypothetical protein
MEVANKDKEDQGGTAAQGYDDDLDASEAHLKPLSSSHTLRFVAIRRSCSWFRPSLSLLSPALTPGPLTPDLLVAEPRAEPSRARACPRPGTPEPDHTLRIVMIRILRHQRRAGHVDYATGLSLSFPRHSYGP